MWGASLSWTIGDAKLEFQLEDVDVAPDALLLAAGQANDVVVKASNLTWGQHSFTLARATIHNIHTRAGRRPRLVGAPIDLLVQATAQYVSDRVSARVPWLRIQFTDTGDVQAGLERHPGWGWVKVLLDMEGDRILARPQALTLGRRSWRLPTRVPRFPIRLALPSDVRLTGLSVVPNGVELQMRVDERHLDYKDAMSFLSRGPGP